MHSMSGGAVVDVVCGPGEPTVCAPAGLYRLITTGAVHATPAAMPKRRSASRRESPRVTRFTACGAFIPAVIAAVSGGHGDLPVARTHGAHAEPATRPDGVGGTVIAR